jgi:hypothetical protein
VSDWSLPPGLGDFLRVLAAISAVALLVAVALAVLLWRRLRRMRTSGGGFWQTLREVPLGLVVLLDLLDLALDVFSAPLIWFLLRRLRLEALSQVATIEALVPFTAPLPTMTLCWIAARLGFGDDRSRGKGNLIEGVRVGPGRWTAEAPRSGEGGDRSLRSDSRDASR